MDEICKKIGFKNWIKVESVGYNGGIWVFWTGAIYLIEDQTRNCTILAMFHSLCKPFPLMDKKIMEQPVLEKTIIRKPLVIYKRLQCNHL